MSAIFVENIPETMSSDELMTIFSVYGSCSVIKVKKEAQITFTDNTAGAEALSKEDGINGMKVTLVSGLGSVKKNLKGKPYKKKGRGRIVSNEEKKEENEEKKKKEQNDGEIIEVPEIKKGVCYVRKSAPPIKSDKKTLEMLVKSLSPK